MFKKLSLYFLTLLLPCHIGAQVFPKEGSVLNYRLIGFSLPAAPETGKYKIEIATGNYDEQRSFDKNIIHTIYSEKNKIIIEVPAFGCQYTWRVEYFPASGRASGIKDILHHFSTGAILNTDTSVSRLRILNNTQKYKDAFIFIDATRTLYDMKGKPVWFIPDFDTSNYSGNLRDVKISPQATVTFITDSAAIEMDYNGKILWQNKDIATHHEFTCLSNGHYMCIGAERVFWKLPSSGDSVAQNTTDSARFYRSVEFGTLVELDKNSNVIWRWRVADYVKNSDIFLQKKADDPFYTDMHENSFYFDQRDNTVYLSFKRISRIIKIKYPEGDILNTYGAIYKPGTTKMANALFCNQHSISVTDDGYLLIYNNNVCTENAMPGILMMKEPINANGKLEKIWEYACTIDDTTGIEQKKPYFFPSGGNVTELPDRSMFVSMSKPYSKLFIIDRDKKILWSAIPEKYNAKQKKWHPDNTYKASIITTRSDLEKLIWSSEKKSIQ